MMLKNKTIKTIASEYFTYKTKLIAGSPNDNNRSDVWLIDFDLPLINCETKLDLKWTKNCVMSEIYKTPEVPTNRNADLPNLLIQATANSGATFQINNAKLYVPLRL